MKRALWVFSLLNLCGCAIKYEDLNANDKVITCVKYNIPPFTFKYKETYDFHPCVEIDKLWPESKEILRREYYRIYTTAPYRNSVIDLYGSVLDAKGYDDDDIDFFWNVIRNESSSLVNLEISYSFKLFKFPPRCAEDIKYMIDSEKTSTLSDIMDSVE